MELIYREIKEVRNRKCSAKCFLCKYLCIKQAFQRTAINLAIYKILRDNYWLYVAYIYPLKYTAIAVIKICNINVLFLIQFTDAQRYTYLYHHHVLFIFGAHICPPLIHRLGTTLRKQIGPFVHPWNTRKHMKWVWALCDTSVRANQNTFSFHIKECDGIILIYHRRLLNSLSIQLTFGKHVRC